MIVQVLPRKHRPRFSNKDPGISTRRLLEQLEWGYYDAWHQAFVEGDAVDPDAETNKL